jgi:hypothetical protein
MRRPSRNEQTILRDRTNEIVNERYRFTNIRNSAMRIVGALGVALAGLSVISVGVVTAYGFDMRSQYGGTTAAIVETREICACLPTIGLLIRCWAAGQWLKMTVRAQRRCT